MKIATLTQDGFKLQQSQPLTINNDEILIKTLACGVCSGDVYVYKNRAQLAETYGRLGHEATGEVIAIGQEVTNIQVGDIVTALASPAYAEQFVAAADRVVKLPSTIDPVYALGEAVACCVHASWRFGIQPGDRVAMVGCGFMGLVCLQLAKHQGAGHIAAVDLIGERLELSQQLGADTAYDLTVVDEAQILAEQAPFDVVIESAGTQGAVDLSTKLVAEHGRIVLIGYHQSNDGQRTVNMERWNYKAIDVVNGHVRREDEKTKAMAEGMALLEQGQLVTEPLITIYNFDDIEHSFHQIVSGTPGLLKAVLLMHQR